MVLEEGECHNEEGEDGAGRFYCDLAGGVMRMAAYLDAECTVGVMVADMSPSAL